MGRAEDLFDQFKAEGVSATERCILERQSEELFLDFKRSGDDGASPKKLHDSDRKNLARAISGFANSEGGVIVWGVDCSIDFDGADVAKARRPIQNVKRFAARLEGATSACTLPPHRGVVNHPIPLSEDSPDGIVVTLVPKIVDAPVQNATDQKFYIRAGSSFAPAGQGQIVSLFARRSEPIMYPTWGFTPVTVDGNPPYPALMGQVRPALFNHGPGIARDVHMTLALLLPGKESEVGVELLDQTRWDYEPMLGMRFTAVLKDGCKVAPKAQSVPFALRLKLKGPFDKDLRFKLTFGTGAGPVIQCGSRVSTQQLSNSCAKFMGSARDQHESEAFLSEMLGFDQLEEQLKPYFGNIGDTLI